MITSYNSKKIRFFSSFLIVMVVYLHSYYLEGEQYLISRYIQDFVGGGICGAANYMFFLISGYLFFHNIGDFLSIKQKMRKRVQSLLVPYILWNVIFLLWYCVLGLIPSLSDKFVNGSIITKLIDAPWYEGLYMVFVMPAAFQLWFLRDLLIFVLLSPALYWLLLRFTSIFPAILLLGSMIEPTIGFLAMFVLGGCLSVKEVEIDSLTVKLKRVLPLFLLLYIIGAIVYPFHIDWLKPFHALIYLSGIISLWCLYDMMNVDKYHWYESLLGYSFFIYCFHIPFFNIVKKLNLMIIGESQINLIILYFVNPIIAVALIVLIAKLLQYLLPKCYKVLTGYRK